MLRRLALACLIALLPSLASAQFLSPDSRPRFHAGAQTNTKSLSLGLSSSITGQLNFLNSTTTNITTLQAGAASASKTYTWPLTTGAANSVLFDTAGNGTLSWNGSTGTGLNVLQTAPNLLGTLQIGTVSVNTGAIALANSSSAFLTTIQAGNASAAKTYTWPLTTGAANSVLTDVAGNGTLSWAVPSVAALTVGTTAVTGGSAGNLLYTDGSLLQATGGITFVGTGQQLNALGTITTNLKAINITGTWNLVGTTFDAPLFMNITNTNSATLSQLMDLQLGGATVFSVGLIAGTPALWFNQTPGANNYFFNFQSPNYFFNTPTGSSFGFAINNSTIAGMLTAGFQVGGTLSIGWGATGALSSADTTLFRDSGGVIADRNGSNAQIFRVYNTFASSTSYERGVLDWATNSNIFTIGTEKGSGGGSIRNIRFTIGGTTAMDMDSSGNVFVTGAFVTSSGGGAAFNHAGSIGIYSNQIQLPSGATTVWTQSTSQSGGTPDIGFARNAGGIVEVDNGTPGTFRDLSLRHMRGNGAPTANSCVGFALGTGSSDLAGSITYTSATTCSITFAASFTNAPFCQITPGSSAATTEVVTTTGGFTATFGAAQTAFYYACFGL